MMLRVRRAASSSIAVRSRCSGAIELEVVVLVEPGVAGTPMLASTSRMRLTSSIRATLRSVVRPLLSSAAHSSATPAFLLDLTLIEPDSVVPPTTRRCIGPETPSETISESRASPIRASISRVRFWWPRSIRLIALWLVPRISASCGLGAAPGACVRRG